MQYTAAESERFKSILLAVYSTDADSIPGLRYGIHTLQLVRVEGCAPSVHRLQTTFSILTHRSASSFHFHVFVSSFSVLATATSSQKTPRMSYNTKRIRKCLSLHLMLFSRVDLGRLAMPELRTSKSDSSNGTCAPRQENVQRPSPTFSVTDALRRAADRVEKTVVHVYFRMRKERNRSREGYV